MQHFEMNVSEQGANQVTIKKNKDFLQRKEFENFSNKFTF